MDRLREIERFTQWKKDDDLEPWLKKLLFWVEGFYREISKRVNWLLQDNYEAHTADDTIYNTETRTVHTNAGATGTVTLTLETPDRAGIKMTFAVETAQFLRVDPGAKAIIDDSGVTSDKYKTSNTVGTSLQLTSNEDYDWVRTGGHGSWTEEV